MYGPEWTVFKMLLSGGFTSDWLLSLLFSLPAILIALSFHEFAHAWVANKMGDPTAKNAGRLTLDPVKHLDLIGTICLILFRFGWAKPVPINPRNFKNPRRDEILVSLAGIGMNVLISFVAFGVMFWLIITKQVAVDSLPFYGLLAATNANAIIFNIVNMMFLINVFFAVFNLIPIPPLDGFHIISAIFIRKAGQAVSVLYRYGFLILIILLFTGVINQLLTFFVTWMTVLFANFFLLFT